MIGKETLNTSRDTFCYLIESELDQTSFLLVYLDRMSGDGSNTMLWTKNFRSFFFFIDSEKKKTFHSNPLSPKTTNDICKWLSFDSKCSQNATSYLLNKN